MKLIFKLLIIIFLLYHGRVLGQYHDEQNCFANIFIDRPMLKIDSMAIISHQVSKIKLYESVSDDSIPRKILIGEWKVFIADQKIKSTVWTSLANDSLFTYVQLGCYPLIKRKFYKNKIVDLVGFPKDSTSQFIQFRLTHFVNKFGRIYQTNNNIIGKPIEGRYLFDKIDYQYNGDFLVEVDFYSSWRFIEQYALYTRLFYEYEMSHVK